MQQAITLESSMHGRRLGAAAQQCPWQFHQQGRLPLCPSSALWCVSYCGRPHAPEHASAQVWTQVYLGCSPGCNHPPQALHSTGPWLERLVSGAHPAAAETLLRQGVPLRCLGPGVQGSASRARLCRPWQRSRYAPPLPWRWLRCTLGMHASPWGCHGTPSSQAGTLHTITPLFCG